MTTEPLADVIKEVRAWLEWLKERGHTHTSIPIAEMHTWLTAAEKAERYEKALAELGPFEIVRGDCIWRTNPSSRQVLNSNAAWLVSNGNVRAHRLRELLKALAPEQPAQEPCKTCLGLDLCLRGGTLNCPDCNGTGRK